MILNYKFWHRECFLKMKKIKSELNILQIYAANKVDGSINRLVNITTKLRLVNVVKMRAHTDSNENQMKLYKRKRVDAVEKKSKVLRGLPSRFNHHLWLDCI